ncbi:GyrI-like domain-containing protein [Brackiella oedipodis]|uniref:GyrI-like domain-containing protein n=1 Tax=Brackiella oedipodis TaxID=124225 RepID=UPI0006882DA2|nr:GyrI-like domain-containing protein [Brackiella oedipodis]
MTFAVQHIEAFTVHGIQVQTTPQAEGHIQTAKLPLVWFAVDQELFLDPNQKNFYGVTQAQGQEENSPYLFTAGAKEVIDAHELDLEDAKMAHVQVQAGTYLVFERSGRVTETAMKLWIDVWEYFNSADCQHKRLFATDFEEYLNYHHDNMTVRLYIGVET